MISKTLRAKIILLLSGFLAFPVFAHTFKVTAIVVEGNERISKETITSYLPIKIGDTVDSHQSGKLIQTLYDSGFFEDIHLRYQGTTLIVEVKERSSIKEVNFDGNRKIDTKKLEELLKPLNLLPGQTVSETLIEKARAAIQEEYLNQGYYNAKISWNIQILPHQLASVSFHIHEGRLTKIQSVHILGNHEISEKVLLSEFSLGATDLWSFFTNNDRYSKAKLLGDLEKLRSFYLDRGYLKFQIESTQVSLSPERQGLYITIRIHEGEVYRINNINLSGETIVDPKKLQALIKENKGDIFSRKKIIESTSAMTGFLGDRGYTFASIDVQTPLDEQAHTVDLDFKVIPGKKTYVRRIGFSGHVKTRDEVLRRQMVQQEGSEASLKDISESARRLRLLEYFKDVQVTTARVPGIDDQIDIGFNLTEAPAATGSVAFSYGTNGFMFQLGFNQENFLGSGKTIGFDFSNDRFNKAFSIYYDNPYYTVNGVSRGFNLYSERTTPGKVNAASYTTDQYGANLNYGIPLTADNKLDAGIGFDHTKLSIGSSAGNELRNFVNRYGEIFNQAMLTAGWRHNGLDQAIFPNQGLYHSLSAMLTAPVGGNSLEFYKINYRAQFYQPLYKDFVLILKGNFGFGDGYGRQDELPFLKNYYAGGIGSLLGYESNTLGPRDSRGEPLGGNLLMTGSVGMVIPQPFSDSVRAILVLGAGGLFNTHADVVRKSRADFINGSTLTEGRFDLDQIRGSIGVEINWRSALGPLVFSLATPLKIREGDKKEIFAFTIGTSL